MAPGRTSRTIGAPYVPGAGVGSGSSAVMTFCWVSDKYMKMISSTSSTSRNGVTFGSACIPPRTAACDSHIAHAPDEVASR
jgi:hypothetical protein